MARTLLPFLLLTLAVGCRNSGGDRDVGAAPKGYDRPRDLLRTASDPDEPGISADERARRGRAKYSVSDVDRDPQEKYRGLVDRYGPVGR